MGRAIVNNVLPGFTETDMLPQDPEWRKMGASMSAFGRLGQPKDMADVVAFLVSERGRWITAQNILACGRGDLTLKHPVFSPSTP